MSGPEFAWRRLVPCLSAALLAACAVHPAVGTAPIWAYLGNDPAGTQNVYMRSASVDSKQNLVTALYRFEFTSPLSLTTGDFREIQYVERHDKLQVDCGQHTLRLLDETYLNVEGHQVYHVEPAPGDASAAPVYAGGVSDLIYAGACGKSLAWVSLGMDPQQTQDIYGRMPDTRGPSPAIVKAHFRFVYKEPRQLVTAPALKPVSYQSRQADVMVDCPNQTVTLLHETYFDADEVDVFNVSPPKDTAPESVVPNSVTGIMYKAACGIPLNWTYLGVDPRNTEKIYLLGQPDRHSDGNVEARFRFEYLAPGKLTTGANLQQVQYSTRTADMMLDCNLYTQTLLRESYQDAAGKEVFTVKPAHPQPVLVSDKGAAGMMQKAGCQP